MTLCIFFGYLLVVNKVVKMTCVNIQSTGKTDGQLNSIFINSSCILVHCKTIIIKFRFNMSTIENCGLCFLLLAFMCLFMFKHFCGGQL